MKEMIRNPADVVIKDVCSPDRFIEETEGASWKD
jgi:hypothetical protein